MDVAADGTSHQPSFEIEGFEPITKLGSGGFGVVWKARQARIDRLVAIKVSHTMLENKEDQLFFDRECGSLGRLSGNPNIVQVYTTGHLKDGRPYLVLEYIDGGTLADRLKKTRVPYGQVRRLGIDLCDGLAYAHRLGVLHRDIKPDNVFLRSNGSAVLGDFGIAQLIDTTKSSVGTMAGSLRYMAPEVLQGGRPTSSSDLYGVGITLHTAMTRQLPFSGESGLVEQVMHRVLNTELRDLTEFGYPKALSDLVISLVHRSHDERPESATEVAKLFASLPEVERQQTPKPTILPPPPLPAKRTRPVADPAKTELAPSDIHEHLPDGSINPRPTNQPKPQLDPTSIYPENNQPKPQLDPTSIYPENQRADEPRLGPGGTRRYPTPKSKLSETKNPPRKLAPSPPQPKKSQAAPPTLRPQNEKIPPPAPTQIPPTPTVATVLFEGTDYNSPETLAEAIARNWDTALANLSDVQSPFFATELTKASYAWNLRGLAYLVSQFPPSDQRQRHQLLTDLLIQLDPQQQPTYRGYKIDIHHLRGAHEFPPVVVDEIRRGKILLRWRQNYKMAGITEYDQQWEQSIKEYDRRNQTLNISDQNAGGKLLAAVGDPAAVLTLKKILLTNPDHSKAGQQQWWAELYSSETIAGLLLAQETLPTAVKQTTTADARIAKTKRLRSLRTASTIIVGLATLATSAIVANRWHMVDSADRSTTIWVALATIPFLFFWYLSTSSNNRGLVAGGCRGSIAWLTYVVALAAVGVTVGMNEQLRPDMSSLGLFFTLASVTVPLVMLLVYRHLTRRLKLKQIPGTATPLSK